MARERERFWMVYGMGQRSSTFRHTSRMSADREAKRLALANPGIEFIVLEAVGGFITNEPVEPIRIIDDIPF